MTEFLFMEAMIKMELTILGKKVTIVYFNTISQDKWYEKWFWVLLDNFLSCILHKR